MKIANYIMGIIRITFSVVMIMIPALFGAMYILEEVMYDEEWAVIFFIPFAIMTIWKLVKIEIIEIKELKK